MNTNTNKLKTTLTALSLIKLQYLQSQQHMQLHKTKYSLPLSILKDSMTTSTVQGMCATWKKLAETAALTL